MTPTSGPLALPSGEAPPRNPLGVFARPTATRGWRSWITTVDHKRIGIMYGAASLFFLLIGGIEALLIRVQLATPDGQVLSADAYNQVYTMHGTTMIFLVVMPIGAAFMNYLIPLQIGARDVAFPRLNALSFWTFLGGGILLNSSWLLGGGADGGWFNYAPNNGVIYSPSHGIDFWNMGLIITGIASLVGAINLIVTCLNLRAPGMKLFRMPVFTWMALVTQFLLLFAIPVLTVAQFLLLFDRLFGARFFDVDAGADPLLWEHLFWIFGHPEVYIMVIPAFGVISEIIPVFSRKPLFGYPFMIFSGIAIGFLGWGVWAHHMFASGIGPLSVAAFSVSTMFIAVPTGVKIFNWLATMWGGRLKLEAPLLYSIGLVTMFTIGGLSGVTHAVAASDTQQTDTYYIVAHFHYVLFGGALFGFIGGWYFWWPKVFGYTLGNTVGKVNFWILLVGFNLTFGPMHILGLQGMPRRTYTYRDGYGFNLWNFVSTIGAFTIAVSFLVFFWNIWSSYKKAKASGLKMVADPWDGRSLEWTIQSPTPVHNFDISPTVHRLDDFWHRKYQENGDGKLVRIATSEQIVQPGNPRGVHLPSPSYWPIVLAAGLPFVGWGLIFNLWLCLVGGILIVAAIYGWVLEPSTAPEAARGPDDHVTPPDREGDGGQSAATEEAALVD
ncbi:cytochrome c oxidase subunit I [Iamia sp.]|uniref:cytochrome c oxidase subunit I n=1 Tax=Iamia sp. TaxID=2722710 RepID=UPI002B62C3B8|nr:cytochrome c oxidase subunit I [Iamia sp.]HXH56660.1 cytochrome c oxidase subunit I [Iamia sp.]